MIENTTKLFGIEAQANVEFRKGMPVSLATIGGTDMIVPYTTVNNNYCGVCLEEQGTYGVEVQRIGKNIISVGATGLTQVVSGGVINFGDMIIPTETGYIKTTDETASVGKALSKATATGEYIKALLYRI